MDSSFHLSRRGLLAAAGAAALTAWIPAFRVPARADAPGFPLPLYRQAYQNWSEEITIENALTCAPTTPADVVAAANWAQQNGYRLRPKGMGHNWSPILLPNGADTGKVILVDTTQHLTAVGIDSSTVTAQTGVTMDALLAALETAGLGFAAIPAPGDITLGGALAINAHGSAIPAQGESRLPGTGYGSLSNLIRSLTAVVWSGNAFTLKTFTRTDPAMKAFLTHLGRAFVTEVTLEVGVNQRLRCQSRYDIQVTDVFAAPSAAGSNSFASLLNACGRIEVIWFPFTTVPWIKLWTVSPSRPLLSKQVTAPYNYTFANFIDQQQSDYIEQIVAGDVSVTPAFENLEMSIVGSGLITTGTWDVWGWSKNTLLYVQPTTLRIVEAGYAVLTARANIQRVVSEFYTRYVSRINAYRAQGRYPMNGPVEIRVTGLDQPSETGVGGAVTPQLSSVRPRPDHPEWDVCVWLDMGTIPGTPQCNAFYREMEQWIFANYTGAYAAVRPEWSKAWAITNDAAWADTTVLTSTVRSAVNAGQAAGDGFDAARTTLNTYDPYRVFSNTFLDVLLP
ncbi:cholesterol oxidase substrate-binding domain-containing protein [Actinoallomurus rhizosphaericola]|uniref:cholesterol oxidase substrate-binding domain-containing protein n=1 Tax=Actinoallomurus rhizosphaericola TaxID=2952536 RepID=UPI0020911A43|nr:cholesterol oxidase substrate-binding domain-containing protein [Actinoallomurus rhizosphaericola]MCO5993246.1 FAD-binding protein [Actinoallomurus rhizosphaericola]